MRALFNLPAPAKINWFLHVTGRRADGYHTLQTVFQFIDWCDSIDLVVRDDGVICRHGADDLPADDLCVRATRSLQQATGCTLGVDITLRKTIPQQAGLGGGSSDAATVLIGLNRLWNLRLSRARLMQLALQLGADVPVFIFGRNAWAQGIGEDLQAIDLPTPRFAVVHPARGLSTQAVFSTLDLTTLQGEAKIAGFAEWLAAVFAAEGEGCGGGESGGAASCSVLCGQSLWGRNDLQAGAEMLEPAVAWAARELQQLQPRFAARMTGSGSAVFAVVGTHDALGALPAGWTGRVCQGLARHPLQHWIQA